jgi:DNA-binding transcriptional LysR family regulator
LGRLLNVLARALPDVDLDLAEMVTREQVAGLLNEEVDLGLARPPFDEEAFGSRLLHREAMLVAAPVGHRLLGLGRPVEAADLASEPVVMHSPTKARYFYDLVVGVVPAASQNTVHTVSQVLTMLWLVAAGRGIAFVPESAARLAIEGVGFALLHTPTPQPVELHLLWARESKNPALWRTLAVLERDAPVA